MIVKELIFRNAQRNSIMIFLIAGFVSMSVFLHPFVSIAIASLLLAGLFFAQHMDFALYVLILMTPFVDFQIVWGELNVPIADAFAMLMFISWALRALLFRGESITNTIRSNTPVAIPFLLFLIACTLSFFNTPDMAASIKYFLRPMLFFYLMFMIIPYVSIENTKILKRALVVSFTLGIVISLMGLISLFLPEQSGEIFRRALPISIFGMYPLGTNHNLIAEVLVAVIPLGWFLSTHERNKHRKQALKLASVFVASICVLTFSRAGWIVLFSEIILYLFYRYFHEREKLWRLLKTFIIAVIPLALVMYFFSHTLTVQNSNANRNLLNAIAFQAWTKHPWIGNGLNTFLPFVQENTIFILEFGSALESHGVIQKLAVEVGLIGTAAFFIFLTAVGRNLYTAYQKSQPGEVRDALVFASIAAFGILLFEFFNTSYFIGKLWLPIGIALATANMVRTTSQTQKSYEWAS